MSTVEYQVTKIRKSGRDLWWVTIVWTIWNRRFAWLN